MPRDAGMVEDPRELAAEPGEVEIDRLAERPAVAAQPLHHPDQEEQERDAGEEDDPAFEEVQEALGLADAVAVDEDADDADPDRVHQHRDRHRRGEQHHLVPDRAAVEHREDVGEAHDREEVAQSRAGLGHLQLVDPEVDDVAVEIDRHPHRADEPDPDLGGDELQPGVEAPVEELRQRQHEDEMQHRRPEDDAAPRPEQRQHQAEDPDDQRVEDDVVDLHQVAERGDRQGQPDHQHAPAAVGDRAGSTGGTSRISRRKM